MIHRIGLSPAAPLADREQFLNRLSADRPPSSVVLATCDRVEVYHGQGVVPPEVARHLFRVVSGLDSPLLGESQIQGQVKRAYLNAAGKGDLDPGLHRLFQQALRVGKRVRRETQLGVGAVGHAQVVAQILDTLPGTPRLLVLGVNNLSRGILRYWSCREAPPFFLGNRTLAKAQEVVDDLGFGEALQLGRLVEVLAQVDVVISATSAPHLMVRASDLPKVGGPRWFFDLAVPRDIDPAVGHRPGCRLFDVSDLEAWAQKSHAARRAEVPQAEAILEEEVARFAALVGAGG